jgi:hypothetical protein
MNKDINKNINEDIIFTTAYKDINRKKWKYYAKSNETYLDEFLNLAFNIEYTLIVYLETYILQKIKHIKFNNNIIFQKLEKVYTFYDKYIDIDKQIIDSNEYKNKIPNYRKYNPEHCQYGYNLINHSKICFLAETKKKYPNYKFYSWIDFGTLNKNVSNIPKKLNLKLISEKITYCCLNKLPEKRIDPNLMLKTNKIYFTGGSIIIYFKYIDILYNLWENKIIEFQKNKITDDDQNLIFQIYFDKPELFDIKYSQNWSSLFKENFNNK